MRWVMLMGEVAGLAQFLALVEILGQRHAGQAVFRISPETDARPPVTA